MKLIDTHCHLCSDRFKGQTDAVIDQAFAAGVVGLICAAADLRESQAAADLANRRSEVYCMAGLHPHDSAKAPKNYLESIKQLTDKARNVAIGEIGLDYHYNYSPPADQRRIFAEQLELAKALGKRAVIHTREAFDDTLAILSESGFDARNAVFHSFTEGPGEIQRILDLGAMVSFSGIVTFRNCQPLREAAAIVPPDRLLIETDSPFLSPEPVRKMQINVPANVVHVAGCLAAVRKCDVEALAGQTSRNAVEFFSLDIGT